MRNNENNIDFFSIPSRTFTRGITICIMISRYERQNDNSFSFLKQELDRIESRPQFFLMYSDPRGWFQIICIKQLNLNLGGKWIWIRCIGIRSGGKATAKRLILCNWFWTYTRGNIWNCCIGIRSYWLSPAEQPPSRNYQSYQLLFGQYQILQESTVILDVMYHPMLTRLFLCEGNLRWLVKSCKQLSKIPLRK